MPDISPSEPEFHLVRISVFPDVIPHVRHGMRVRFEREGHDVAAWAMKSRDRVVRFGFAHGWLAGEIRDHLDGDGAIEAKIAEIGPEGKNGTFVLVAISLIGTGMDGERLEGGTPGCFGVREFPRGWGERVRDWVKGVVGRVRYPGHGRW